MNSEEKNRLLTENQLIWSPVVANSAMNRERKATGVNSYEKEFRLHPGQFLEDCVRRNGQASWLDLCCGQGSALIQTARYFADKNLQEKVTLTGVDLLDAFQHVPASITCLQLQVASIVNWRPSHAYDLITCSHGLHYLGDKLKAIAMAVQSLRPDGLFIGQLDLQNIHIKGADSNRYIKSLLKQHAIAYNSRNKMISCKGPVTLQYDCRYLGADDNTGPNYTGQGAVTSFYDASPLTGD